MPLFRIPFHVSYLLYLSAYSRPAALAYCRTALAFCRWAGVEPSLLLHPLDFLGREDGRALEFFPGMGLPSQHKLELLAGVFDLLGAAFTPVNMQQHAEHAVRAGKIPLKEPARILAPEVSR
jgi:hypothetical protein